MILDWIAFKLLTKGPWKLTCDPYTPFGRWCLSRGGAWAFREQELYFSHPHRWTWWFCWGDFMVRFSLDMPPRGLRVWL